MARESIEIESNSVIGGGTSVMKNIPKKYT
jgi:hypothetical protein